MYSSMHQFLNTAPEHDEWTCLLYKRHNHFSEMPCRYQALQITIITSTSHRALELVAEVADCRNVVLRKTCCRFMYSSQVRNFSCSAWNSLTTSPWKRTTYRSINMARHVALGAWKLKCFRSDHGQFKFSKYEKTHPLQDIIPVVTKLHEQGDFPAGVAVDSVHLQHETEIRNK